MGSRTWTKVITLGRKHPSLLSKLTDPSLYLSRLGVLVCFLPLWYNIDKISMGRTGPISACSLQPISRESQGKNSRPNLEEETKAETAEKPYLLTCSLCLLSSSSLIWSKITCSGVALPIVCLAFPHQSLIKIMSPQMYVQDNLMEAVLQLRLPLPRCIKSTTKVTCRECRQWLLQLRAPNSSVFLPQNSPKHESHMVRFSTATSLGLMVLESS